MTAGRLFIDGTKGWNPPLWGRSPSSWATTCTRACTRSCPAFSTEASHLGLHQATHLGTCMGTHLGQWSLLMMAHM